MSENRFQLSLVVHVHSSWVKIRDSYQICWICFWWSKKWVLHYREIEKWMSELVKFVKKMKNLKSLFYYSYFLNVQLLIKNRRAPPMLAVNLKYWWENDQTKNFKQIYTSKVIQMYHSFFYLNLLYKFDFTSLNLHFA